jgi:hypothetical protein
VIAERSNTPIREVMEWPIMAVQEYIDRVLPLLKRDE